MRWSMKITWIELLQIVVDARNVFSSLFSSHETSDDKS